MTGFIPDWWPEGVDESRRSDVIPPQLLDPGGDKVHDLGIAGNGYHCIGPGQGHKTHPPVRSALVGSQAKPLGHFLQLADRLFGLGRVVVYTAGSRGADVSVPGLTPERADELREQLRELAIENEESIEDAV